MSEEALKSAGARLRGAQRVLVLTGAGVSAESGVPTFRGPEGLWGAFRPEDLATAEAFARDAQLVWQWYDWRRQLIAPLAPNRAHEAIAALEREAPDFLLATQNVDGLHRRAGSREPLELHGNLFRTRCTREGTVREVDVEAADGGLPPCPDCGSL
ncbi:MAG TPA: Sir2 family NAD-dependent protein deacetylase, partial [Vicinamibacteria bacterium]